jgi:superfamily I DNA/RNA helicase
VLTGQPDHSPSFTASFLQHEWEQVILAQDMPTEQAYLNCLRTGRGRPLSKTQRSLVWRAAGRVTAGLRTAGLSTHIQLANEATHLLREAGRTLYRHVIVDEAQDLHPAQWRLLRAAVSPGPDDLFISADPHQRIYDNRVSLASLGVQVRGRSRRLTMNYRTTQEILVWAVPLLGSVRAGTMHGMKGLEFQAVAVAVIGVEQGTMPALAALTPASEDSLAHAQDLQRERCVLFVACTRARDHLYVSYVGDPSPFLP